MINLNKKWVEQAIREVSNWLKQKIEEGAEVEDEED